ncbi:MAG: polyphosphate kinase 1, partial [Dongiaceae bacterium]
MNSSSPTQFLNRELSSIAFNRRVLEEANNKANPLLERVRFLAIVGSNLDEFTNVRVASLRDQVAASNTSISDDGLTPEAQLAAIREAVAALGQEAQNSWRQLQPLLDKENIRLVKAEALTAPQREKLEAYFQEHIFPVLTPLAIDPAHPFPHMPNRGFALIMHLTENTKEAKVLRAIVPMPPQIHRFVPLIAEANEHSFMLVEDVVALFLDKLFPNFTATDTGVFRILRDSEVEATEETDDLVGYYERLLKLRKRGDVIRLIVRKNMPADLHALLLRELRVQPVDVLEVDGVIGLMDLQELVKIERNDLKFPAFTPRYPERVRDFNGDIFAAIKAKDIILHHPYESFDVVVQFLQQAAQDPNVVAIRQTLYRTSQDSSVMRALIEAAEAGKSVTVMVELKARFDEEANLRWARNLERAGAQVIFGFIDLKTHAKIALVTRREGDGLRSYVHFGTGNYNSITSRVYTDLS